jgi:hypothetical protein
MRKFWNWFRWVLLGLVVVGLLVGAGFAVHAFRGDRYAQRINLVANGVNKDSGEQYYGMPMMGWRSGKGQVIVTNEQPQVLDNGEVQVLTVSGVQGGCAMSNFGAGRGGRGMMRFGGGFMGFGMFFAWLVPLALLGLLVYGAFRWGQRKHAAASVAPAATAGESPVVDAAPARMCPKCGYAVQDGWQHCANCGKRL